MSSVRIVIYPCMVHQCSQLPGCFTVSGASNYLVIHLLLHVPPVFLITWSSIYPYMFHLCS